MRQRTSVSNSRGTGHRAPTKSPSFSPCADEAAASVGSHPGKNTAPATLYGLFEEQARHAPAAVAVICGDRRLSYCELELRAEAVAQRLRQCGVQRGSLVGLHVEQSLDLAVGVLGIVKAGGAYVPLDPAYPADRLAFMVADAEVEVLLTQRRLAGKLPQSRAQVVCLDDLRNPGPGSGNDPGGAEATGTDLAYVIYTSGSTGQPKGVMIEHRAVANTIVDMTRRFSVGPNDRVLALSSYGFDLSVYDMFGIWAAGGSVVIPEPADAREPARWARLLQQHQVTIWNSVPAAMEMLVTHQTGRRDAVFDSLRLVLLSGDWIPLTLPDRVRAINPLAQLVSLGGATEASIWSIVYPIGRCEPQWKSIPYGRAMANQSIHVLNEQLVVCPPGEVGQLYIGGVGLARGYLRRPALTAERFITSPRSSLPAARLYATGDLGRLCSDGTIEFLGRIDGQVKIRGYRVELGEVEAALCQHPAIGQAVAVAKEHLGHKQLVAYVVASGQPAPTASELRRFLQQSLPEYLVPAHFVVLDRLPLTANQKVDRQALATVDPTQVRAPTSPVAPRDTCERRLVDIWQECFDLEPLGIEDNFFDLGGDSLLAAGLFARVEREFGQVFSLDVLLERPTVRLLADLLRNPMATDIKSSVVSIQTGQSRPPLFCVPGIGGNVLEFRGLARQLGPEQPIYGLRPAGLDDGQRPHHSITEMAAHCIRQMRTIQPQGPFYMAGYSLGGVVAFEMAHQLSAQGEEVALLALLDSQLSAESVQLSIPQRLRIHWRTLWYGIDGGRWSYLRSHGRLLAERIRRGNLRQDDDDVIIALDLSPSSRKVARLHLQALRSYEPRIYDGKIVLFVVRQYAAPSTAVASDDPTFGWARWTTQPVEVYLVPGTHAEILHRKELQALAAQLGGCPLAAIGGNASTVIEVSP